MTDTIYAVSSAMGRGGVAVIRVSGPDALSGLQKLASLKKIKPRFAYYAVLKHPDTKEMLDQAVVLYFQGPKSFTGEDCVEYHIHGGRAVIQGMMNVLGSFENYRMAEAGEFTKRAFINGKMDLTEAEAVADLIHAETEMQKLQALSQVSGSLSKIYFDWSDRLKKILAHQEADIEFPDEDMPDGVSEHLQPEIIRIIAELQEHLDDKRRGEILRDGIKIAILGAPNAGKSSLTNLLTQRDVAIVSDQAGTTRDVIETHLDLAGYPVVIADTAGLRKAKEDQIEAIGIDRAKKRAAEADIKIILFDAAQNFDQESLDLIDDQSIIVLNKVDLRPEHPDQEKLLPSQPVMISTKDNHGIDLLLDVLTDHIKKIFDGRSDAPNLTRERHRQSLQHAYDDLQSSLNADLPELAAEDMRMAMRHIGKITGRIDVEDLLDVIFKDFCIGK